MQNAQGGVTKQYPTGSGKTEQIAKEYKPKVYGKRGRRIRAAERLSIDLTKAKTALKTIESDLSKLEKKGKLTPEEKHYYNEILYHGATLHDKQIPYMEKELATLKSRI